MDKVARAGAASIAVRRPTYRCSDALSHQVANRVIVIGMLNTQSGSFKKLPVRAMLVNQ